MTVLSQLNVNNAKCDVYKEDARADEATSDVEKSIESERDSASLRTLNVAPLFLNEAPGAYRTRWLYFWLFVYNSCNGRFMSMYYLAQGLDEAEIGVVFAVGALTSKLIATVVGVLADRLTLTRPRARHVCLAACTIVGAMGFTLQAIHPPGVSRFAVMGACRIITDGMGGSAGILTDAITLQGLADRAKRGEERLYGAVSWAIVHVLLGVSLAQYGHVVQHLLIIVATIFILVTLVAIGVPPAVVPNDNDNSKKPGPGLVALANRKAFCHLLKSYTSSQRKLAFFFYVMALGYGMAIVENLIFLLFKELNVSYFLCGLSVVVTVVFEIPLFSKSKWLLEKCGVYSLLVIAGLCYSFRVVGYTLCPGGWFVLFFEPMHGITIAAFGIASVEMVASITPDEFTATGQAFLNLIRGVGATLGNSVGGTIIRLYGENACYRVSAAIVLLGIAVFSFAARVGSQIPREAEIVPSGEQEVEDDYAIPSATEPETEDSNVPAIVGRQD